METIVAFAQALAKIASSPFVTALAGGLIGYFAAGRGERATLREQRRKREREIQAAFRALVIEMLRTAELALSGSSVVRTCINRVYRCGIEMEGCIAVLANDSTNP
jgi:hypothetical protein